jgi:hypothetical protein
MILTVAHGWLWWAISACPETATSSRSFVVQSAARPWIQGTHSRLIENPGRRCGLVVAFRGPMGLAL